MVEGTNGRTYKVEFVKNEKGTLEVGGRMYVPVLRISDKLDDSENEEFRELLPKIVSYGKATIEYCINDYAISPERVTITLFPDGDLESLVKRLDSEGKVREEAFEWL